MKIKIVHNSLIEIINPGGNSAIYEDGMTIRHSYSHKITDVPTFEHIDGDESWWIYRKYGPEVKWSNREVFRINGIIVNSKRFIDFHRKNRYPFK